MKSFKIVSVLILERDIFQLLIIILSISWLYLRCVIWKWDLKYFRKFIEYYNCYLVVAPEAPSLFSYIIYSSYFIIFCWRLLKYWGVVMTALICKYRLLYSWWMVYESTDLIEVGQIYFYPVVLPLALVGTSIVFGFHLFGVSRPAHLHQLFHTKTAHARIQLCSCGRYWLCQLLFYCQ